MFKRMMIMLCIAGAMFAALAWFVNFRAGMIRQAMATLADRPPRFSATGSPL
jgi:membrane fusion protein, multidrug efflux system